MTGMYMDKSPVTNAQYKQFINATHYKPSDTANYLKHWVKGKILREKTTSRCLYQL